ncbi:glycerol-3-phosphate ABC transporter permease [Paenibacillus sp. CAA11]|uniref:carbohydrate ABC transporter permease n=1 Tax=Paenibacillus sp. CAA11 TaxID=1532905 RepID=UPI000D3CD967|nr:sugar ABC transporter permease [Paenibacillus sp. CAA11]AWB46345.1 glycerol-3-phosphate ABC transporter permease [Paenibacillus sp. CAA11]
MNALERELPGSARSAEASIPVKKRLNLSRLKESALAYFFLAPSLAVFAVFLLYPMIKSIYLSFHLTDPRGRIAAYVGWENFMNLFKSDAFWSSLTVTGKFALLTVPTGIALGLLMAALAHSRLRGMRIFQFIFSLPLALSVSTASVIWMMLFHPTMGMFNYFLSLVGIEPVQWLTSSGTALLSIAIMTLWMNSGFNFIVLLSGLQGISEDIYDSAKIDGAGPIRTFVRLILPLLSPTVFFLSVVSLISSLQSFGQIHLLTKGGPAGSTDVIVYSIYNEAFVNYQFGTGSAMAIVLFLIILALTVFQFTVLEKKVHYQ